MGFIDKVKVIKVLYSFKCNKKVKSPFFDKAVIRLERILDI